MFKFFCQPCCGVSKIDNGESKIDSGKSKINKGNDLTEEIIQKITSKDPSFSYEDFIGDTESIKVLGRDNFMKVVNTWTRESKNKSMDFSR